MPTTPSPAVAIVGAGVAGLTLANRLAEQGVRSVVFDKGRGVAGRMSTRRTDPAAAHAGHTFDHGAQYFTARDAAFSDAVRAWEASGVVAPWRATIGVLRGGDFQPEQRGRTRYVGVPGNNAVCLALADGLRVESAATVVRVERRSDRWRLTDAEGRGLGEFAWFVASAPAPQSAQLLAAAPGLATRAAAVRMTGCWAVMVAFDEPLGPPYGGAFVEAADDENGPLSWIANDSSKPGRPVIGGSERWVLHGSPEWSEANIELDPVDATAQLLEAFWRATGLPPRPTAYERAHRWRYALPPEPLAEPCLFDADMRLGAAGDWCGGPRVEGAFLSGASLADRLLASLA